ncbi:helix-turn-helix transcriptional regulator [Glutamicibacter protophormiae]|uniref:helix-turn-helix transcriptional regulator n=2 Tax=Glutamicibacter protophormiae TaxID=37930 RepID=UPI003A8EA034
MSTKQSSGPSKAERLTSLIYALATTPRKFTTAMIGEYLTPEGSDAAREKSVERLREEIRNDFGLRLIAEEVDGETRYGIDTSDWFLPEVAFTPAESAMISLAASLWKDSKLQALGLKAAARITGSSVPAPVAPFAGSLLPRLSLDAPNFRECALAVFNRKTVKFSYVTAGNVESTREVDMWGIGQRFGNWYFTGFDHTRDAQRVFRLSRVKGNFKTTIRRGGTSSAGYRPRPADFSMSQVLLDFDLRNPGHLATVEIRDDAATPLRVRALNGASTQNPLRIAYADPESFAAELAAYGPAVKVLEPAPLAEQVAATLRAARDAQAQLAADPRMHAASFRPQRATGRGTTASQVLRNIDMIQYVVSHGVVQVEELAERYQMPVDKVREELAMIMMCGVPGGQHDELINVNDGDLEADTVTISNAALLAEPQKLAPLEAVAVLGGLNALASIPKFEHREVLDSALHKINAAVARFEGWNGSLGFALSQVREHDIPSQLVDAVLGSQVLSIDYYSAHSQAHQRREVEPVRLVEDGATQYLRAWCRTREDLLTFRVDRILDAKATGEVFERGPRHRDDEELDMRYRGSAEDLQAVLYVDDEELPAVESFQPTEWSSSKIGSGYLAKVRISYDLVPAPLVARHGGKIAVISPDATRERVREWLDEAIRMYEDK